MRREKKRLFLLLLVLIAFGEPIKGFHPRSTHFHITLQKCLLFVNSNFVSKKYKEFVYPVIFFG